MARFLFVLSMDFSRIWDFTWMVSDCEELVVVSHRR